MNLVNQSTQRVYLFKWFNHRVRIRKTRDLRSNMYLSPCLMYLLLQYLTYSVNSMTATAELPFDTIPETKPHPDSSDPLVPTVAIPTKETAIFLQDACLQHRFIRSRDTSNVVERPERLRAISIGLAAAMARIEESLSTSSGTLEMSPSDDLANALGRMNLAASPDPLESPTIPISVVKSSASAHMFTHPAVKFVHGDVDGDVYLENLKAWARDSHDKIAKGESEIPEGLAQGDLYRECQLSNS